MIRYRDQYVHRFKNKLYVTSSQTPPPIPPINILYILLGCEYRSVFLHAYNCIDNECHPAIDYSYLLHLLAQPTYNC